MPTFTYKSRVRGKIQAGEVEAEDEKSAVSKLKQQNIRATNIKEKGGGSALFGPKVHKITTRDVVIFTRQFSTMVDAGLPLVQCLDILGKQADNPTFGEKILKVKGNIEIGNNLSESLKKFPEIWDSLYCNLVEAGEVGGILDIILRRLAEYIEKAEALKTAVAKITTDLEVSKDEVSEKTDTITDLKQDISYLHAEQYDTVEKYNELVEKFDLIVDNSATSICCTMRFLESDGNTINSFNIEDNAIKCTTGGTFPLDCPNI